MKRVLLVTVMALAAAACAGSAASTTTTVQPAITMTSTSQTTTTTSAPEPSIATTTSSTPSIEAWGTWTLVLASIETGVVGAEDRAREVAAGIDESAVLYSNDFPSLNPGFWVVHWGEFTSGSEAANWCAGLANALTCYPRYLGPAVAPLAADGHAMLIDGQALVIVDVATGDRLKVIDPYFSGEGMGIGRMALTPDASALFYSVGFEDSWYSCESSVGQVWRLDLVFGTIATVASGNAPAVSPDGRWMAVLNSEQCLPDPENPDFWVLTPFDTVVLYNLATGWPVETRRWSVASAPTSYEDARMITWVDWRADSQALLAMNNAGDLFTVALDHEGSLNAGVPVVEGINGYPQALIGDTLYVTRDDTPEEWGGFDLIGVDLATGAEGEVITQTVGWNYAAADTTRTRLIWGSDTQVGTARSTFGLENYLAGFAW
ncbi:MAG: hypothetical protein OEM84_10395 [Acidimicrobiia bacterium]|nr:hypothetical protein [Acidimicrobiia bacterium]